MRRMGRELTRTPENRLEWNERPRIASFRSNRSNALEMKLRHTLESCNASAPVPGTSVSSVKYLSTLTRNFFLLLDSGTLREVRVYLCYNNQGARYSFRYNTKSALCIMTSCLVSHTHQTPNSSKHVNLSPSIKIVFDRSQRSF